MSNDQNLAYNYAQLIAEAIEALATCADEYRAAWEEWQDTDGPTHPDEGVMEWDAAHGLLHAADLTHLVEGNALPDPDDVEDALSEWWYNDVLDVQVLADLANDNSLHEVRCAITLGGPNCWLVWDGTRSWIDCCWGGDIAAVSVPTSAQDWITTGMQIYADNAGADY